MRTLRFVSAAKIAAVLSFVLLISITGFGQTPPKVAFAARMDYAVSALGVATGDLNSDGNLDLVTINSSSVSVLLGNPDGTFQSAVSYSVPALPIFITLADFNGDGKLDILVESFSGGTVLVYSVSVLLGNGDGTFQAAKTTAVTTNGFYLGPAVGDFNGDGKADLALPVAVPQVGDSAMTVMLSNGDGTFQAPITANSTPVPTPRFLETADFNGDGKLDLVSGSDVANAGEISVFLGNGDGTFQQPVNTPASVGSGGFVVADFTGDGKLDIACDCGSTPEATVLPGNGDGTFQPAIVTNSGLQGQLLSADLNGDGKQDLVGINTGISVLLGNGDGTFQTSPLVTNLLGAYAVFGDFDGDGKDDVATVSGVLSVALGKGDGTFQVDTVLSSYPIPISGLANDFTGDGKTDLLEVTVATNSAPLGSVLPGNGDGTFQSPTVFGVKSCPDLTELVPCPTASADLNSDGRVDAVHRHCDQRR